LTGEITESMGGRLTFMFPEDRFLSGQHLLTAKFLGSDRLVPGQATVAVSLP